MQIYNNRELELYDWGYRTGFCAGQLARRRETIERCQRLHAESAGARIAVIRGNISLKEYAQIGLQEEI